MPPTSPEDVDGGTPVELAKAHLPRVDGVAGPANGMPFLVIKAEEADPDAAAKLEAAGITTPVAKDLQTAAAAAADAPMPGVEEQAPIATVTDGSPGSPAWEAADAANAAAAIALLLALKQRVEVAADRERAEWEAPGGEFDDLDNAWDLDDAACSLDWILGLLAKFCVTEQAEATEDVTKAAAPLVAKAAVFMARLYRTPIATPVAKEAAVQPTTETAVTKDDGTAPAAAAPAAESATPAETAPAAEAAPAQTEAPGPVAAAPEAPAAAAPATDTPAAPATEAAAPAPAAAEDVVKSLFGSDVFKAAMATAVTDVVKSALEPVTKGLEDVTKQVKQIAEQPKDGGPLMNGMAGAEDGRFSLVEKFAPRTGYATPDGVSGDPEAIAKAVSVISNPAERDAVSRSLAASLHPALRQQ